MADSRSAQPRTSTPSPLHRDCANDTERTDAREWPPASSPQPFHRSAGRVQRDGKLASFHRSAVDPRSDERLEAGGRGARALVLHMDVRMARNAWMRASGLSAIRHPLSASFY